MGTRILELSGLLMYVHNDDFTYFDSFRGENIPKEIKKFINRSLSIVLRPPLRVATNIFRIQVCDSIMCRYFLYWIY